MQVFDLTRIEPYMLTVDQIDFMETNGNYANGNDDGYSMEDLIAFHKANAIMQQRKQQPKLEVVK